MTHEESYCLLFYIYFFVITALKFLDLKHISLISYIMWRLHKWLFIYFCLPVNITHNGCEEGFLWLDTWEKRVISRYRHGRDPKFAAFKCYRKSQNWTWSRWNNLKFNVLKFKREKLHSSYFQWISSFFKVILYFWFLKNVFRRKMLFFFVCH